MVHKRQGTTWDHWSGGKRLHLPEMDDLIPRIDDKTRVGLSPYMDLMDKIKHP